MVRVDREDRNYFSDCGLKVTKNTEGKKAAHDML